MTRIALTAIVWLILPWCGVCADHREKPATTDIGLARDNGCSRASTGENRGHISAGTRSRSGSGGSTTADRSDTRARVGTGERGSGGGRC